MPRRPLHPLDRLARCAVPLDEPFTAATSRLRSRDLVALERSGHLRRLCRGVYVGSQTPDTLALRARALAVVLPAGAVVTDETAAWLHGIDLLPANALDAVPDVQVFHRDRGGRIMRDGVISGQRAMPRSDITQIAGVPVTTLLRTGCDLGRLQWRDRAFAGLDAILRAGVDPDSLVEEVGRFRGFRGVRQLRALAPLADPRAGSVAESMLRLRWLDAGLPPPQLQIPVDGPGTTYFLDLGLEEVHYAVEYDGVAFHTAPEDVEHDRLRRDWIRTHTPWIVEVVTRDDLFEHPERFEARLRRGVAAARRTVADRRRGTRWFRAPGD